MLNGFQSYLSDPTQFVIVHGFVSGRRTPKSFVFGPLLYSLYTFSLGGVAGTHAYYEFSLLKYLRTT